MKTVSIKTVSHQLIKAENAGSAERRVTLYYGLNIEFLDELKAVI